MEKLLNEFKSYSEKSLELLSLNELNVLSDDLISILDYNYDKVVRVKEDRECISCHKTIHKSTCCITGNVYKIDYFKKGRHGRVWICPHCFKKHVNDIKDFYYEIEEMIDNLEPDYDFNEF